MEEVQKRESGLAKQKDERKTSFVVNFFYIIIVRLSNGLSVGVLDQFVGFCLVAIEALIRKIVIFPPTPTQSIFLVKLLAKCRQFMFLQKRWGGITLFIFRTRCVMLLCSMQMVIQ